VKSGEEFDAEDVLECLYANYPQEVAGYSTNLARAALRQQVTIELERRSGLDPLQPYPQLNIEGFESVPALLPFYDGDKVRYIATLHAREAHVCGAIKLQEDKIAFWEARLKRS